MVFTSYIWVWFVSSSFLCIMWYKNWGTFFSHTDSHLQDHNSLKRNLFPHWITLTPLLKNQWPIKSVSLLLNYSSHWSVCLSSLQHRHLDYCRFIVSLEIKQFILVHYIFLSSLPIDYHITKANKQLIVLNLPFCRIKDSWTFFETFYYLVSHVNTASWFIFLLLCYHFKLLIGINIHTYSILILVFLQFSFLFTLDIFYPHDFSCLCVYDSDMDH